MCVCVGVGVHACMRACMCQYVIYMYVYHSQYIRSCKNEYTNKIINENIK